MDGGSRGDQPGQIYLLRGQAPFGTIYKIGRGLWAGRRADQVGYSVPFPTELIHFVEVKNDMGRAERGAHLLFAKKHLCGEWYSLSLRDVVRFKRLKAWEFVRASRSNRPDPWSFKRSAGLIRRILRERWVKKLLVCTMECGHTLYQFEDFITYGFGDRRRCWKCAVQGYEEYTADQVDNRFSTRVVKVKHFKNGTCRVTFQISGEVTLPDGRRVLINRRVAARATEQIGRRGRVGA